jgi:NAD(P)-dependent dehydrogenase (short-subunit alcohol dehydrogenase family)
MRSTKVFQMDNRVILITGSTDGIGKQAALELARKGATVLLHGRNPSLVKTVLEQTKKQSQNDNVDLFVADFASLKQVRRFADEVRNKYAKLDVLVNNAGVYMRDRQLTEDRFEMTFAVNHLAPFLLTNLLLDLLKRSAPSKIINVSSMAHQGARLDLNDLQAEKHFEAYGAYSKSKLANLLFTYELAQRLNKSGVTVNALHPGVIATKMLKAGFGSMGGRPVEDGAARITYLVNSPGIENVSGKYFVNDKEQISSSESRDAKLQQQFWSLSDKMVGISLE